MSTSTTTTSITTRQAVLSDLAALAGLLDLHRQHQGQASDVAQGWRQDAHFLMFHRFPEPAASPQRLRGFSASQA